MTNYPNMSYCMCNNTLAAMNQLMDAMEDVDFIDELNHSMKWDNDELRAFNELQHVAAMFAKKAQKMLDNQIDRNVAKVLENC